MEYYLSTFEGNGSRNDPRRPRGAIPGWSMIDLQKTGFCLLAVPEKISQGYHLGNDFKERWPEIVKRRFQNRLGLTLSRRYSKQLSRIVAELLTDHARRDGKPWKPLMPETRSKRWRIYLGGLIYDVPMVGGGTVITESWPTNQDDNLDGDLDWTFHWGAEVGPWEVAGNRAKHSTLVADDFGGWHAGTVATQNHYVQVKIPTLTIGDSTLIEAIVVGRVNSTTTNKECYRYWAQNSSGTLTYEMGWASSIGDDTSLGSNAQDWVTNDTIRVEIDGSSITGKTNGSTLIGPVTDTNVSNAANVYGGIQAYHDGTTSIEEFDDWEMGDIAAGGGPILMARRRRL